MSCPLIFSHIYRSDYTKTYPGSFGTSDVPSNEVTIDCVDPMAGVVAGVSMMIICTPFYFSTTIHKNKTL